MNWLMINNGTRRSLTQFNHVWWGHRGWRTDIQWHRESHVPSYRLYPEAGAAVAPSLDGAAVAPFLSGALVASSLDGAAVAPSLGGATVAPFLGGTTAMCILRSTLDRNQGIMMTYTMIGMLDS